MEDELGVLERVRAEHITAGGSVVSSALSLSKD